MKINKFLLKILLAAAGTWSANATNAQITDAANPDLTITTVPSSLFPIAGLEGLNADMLDLNTTLGAAGVGNDKLWAVAWGTASNGTINYAAVQVGVESNTLSTSFVPATIQLPAAPIPGAFYTPQMPDVVLGNTSAGNYYLGIVYQMRIGATPTSPVFHNAYMEVYQVTLSGTTVNTPTLIAGPILISSGTNSILRPPHIDLLAEPTSPTVTPMTPYMHNFVVTWDEEVSFGNYAVFAATGDLATITTTPPSTQIASNAWNPDVAAVTDPVRGSFAYIAYVSNYGSGTPSLDVAAWDCVSAAPFSIATSTPAGYTNFSLANPRIDGATLYDYSNANGGTVYHAVSEVVAFADLSGMINPTYATWHQDLSQSTAYGSYVANYYDNFTNITGPNYTPFTCPPFSFPWFTFCPIQQNPVVCMTGDFFGGGVGSGNADATIAFYSGGTEHNATNNPANNGGDYFAYPLSNSFVNTGTFPAGVPCTNAWEINLDEVNGFPGSSMPIAVANCTNSGYDMLAVWCDQAGNIRYKFGGTTSYAFKPTSVNAPFKQNHFKVYPNPATDMLHVQGATNNPYSVTNMLGQEILSGNFSNKSSSINISDLHPGAYILSITDNGIAQKIKFTKE